MTTAVLLQEGFESPGGPAAQAVVALVIAAVFVLLALEKAHRVLVVFGAVAFLWLVSYLTPLRIISFEASQAAIDFNVIFLLASMMAIVGVLKATGVFAWAVARLLEVAGTRPIALMGLLAWFTGVLSAFADNVTTVIFVTPMAIEMARAIGVPAPALLLPVVMAANIGGTATLIGDPPNILIGSGAGLSFVDFLVTLAPPVICMMVLLELYTRRYFRGALRHARAESAPAAIGVPPLENRTLLRWGLAISALVFVGFMTHTITGMPAAVPAAIGAAALLVVQDALYLRTRPPTVAERIHGILHVIEREIEWPTLTFFAFLFILVGAAVETGLIDAVAGGLAAFIASARAGLGLDALGTVLFAALLILWVSGLLSALIDNIPYVAVTIPIVATLVTGLGPAGAVLWWSLALGACLGGNGTMIGASANVTVVGLAEKAGTAITFAEFTRFGARVAILTLLVSTAFLAAFVLLGGSSARIGFTALAVAAVGLRLAVGSRAGAARGLPGR